MRKHLAQKLFELMAKDYKIVIVTADLGFGLWDEIKREYPDRFFNVGSSEQSALGIAIGLAKRDYIPFVYSITPFLIYRPYETIKLYLNHEQIPVVLIGSGRNQDYSIDGVTHDATGVKNHLDLFKNIVQYYPETNEEMEKNLSVIIEERKPAFLSLKR